MSKTTTWMVSMKKLADRAELGGLMVRLMMALQDFALANHAMQTWKTEQSQKLKGRKVGAARYFLRMQISHIFEAFEIIQNEIEQSAALKTAIEACNAQTKKSYQTVIEFIKSDDYNLLLRIRNDIGFHYGRRVVLQSLQRLEKRQEKKRKENEYTNEHVALTLGHEALDWHFKPTELVENDVIIHGIFNLPQDEEPADLQAKTDEIVMRLHSVAGVFADFAGHFIRNHAKA
jgi:hypothetical protein